MSWSVSVPKTEATAFAEAVEAVQIGDTYNPAALVAQWNMQLETAKAAVLSIFEQRPFGEGGLYYASMGGHANHGDDAGATGYTSSEFVTITIGHDPAPTA